MRFPARSGASFEPGPAIVPGGVRFQVYAPRPRAAWIELLPGGERHPLSDRGDGVREAFVAGAGHGTRYRYVLRGEDGVERAFPDPASRFQPEGVHGPSEIVDPARFRWMGDDHRPPLLADLVLYELHVGTFSAEGTFEGAIARLPYLRELGVGAIELMPVGAFAGDRGWGYDGVFPFAPHAAYGGPGELCRLVDACHVAGLGVVLDVVLNHFGPEGCALRPFAEYFDAVERTPWGDAVRLEGPGSGAVRRHLVACAEAWVRDFHADGLRLDAVHAFPERSRLDICAEIAEGARAAAHAQGRDVWIFAESDLNDARLVEPASEGGGGADAAWSDDFHHALHALLTGERQSYYADFGAPGDLAAALERGFVYDGRFSRYRGRRHGSDGAPLDGHRFVVATQTHDQVGNRPLGERLWQLAGVERAKLAAVALLLAAPDVPLLFMGEEHAAASPFLYFTSFGDEALARAVREGRRREAGPGAPDPQDPETFARSRLRWELLDERPHEGVLRLYRELLALRKRLPALAARGKQALRCERLAGGQGLAIRRPLGADAGDGEALLLLSWAREAAPSALSLAPGRYRCALHSADVRYAGPGAQGVDAPIAVGAEGRAATRVAPDSAALFLPM